MVYSHTCRPESFDHLKFMLIREEKVGSRKPEIGWIEDAEHRKWIIDHVVMNGFLRGSIADDNSRLPNSCLRITM